MNDAAIINLDFLRRLIQEARASEEFKDALRLRMITDTGVGTDALTAQQEDR
jgi:hypothetical protein